MIPIVPHLASECLSQIKYSKTVTWPDVNVGYLTSEKNTIVVQINGKKRGLIETSQEIEEKDLIEKIRENKELKKFFDNKLIFKSIFIKDKLINLILK